MRLSKNIIFYIILLMVAGSCVEPYFPDDLDYEPMLFIQAIITDNPGIPPRVQLSNTIPVIYEEDKPVPYVNISGANIYVEADDGTRYYFTEGSFFEGYGPGIYYLPDPLFSLEAGKKYMLVVETTEGYRFESGYEPYISPVEIDDIGFEYAREEKSELGDISEGYKFNISTTGQGTDPNYFRWELDHTYRYMVSLSAAKMWTGSELIDTFSYDLAYCYMDEVITGIYIGSTAGLIQNRIIDEPLHFVSQYGDMLQIKYSLHAYQLSISEGAFQFWYNLRRLIYETGGLYETQPFRISGNIKCVSEPAINVAGIFEVAGVSEKRIFVQRPTDFYIYTDRCVPDTIGTPDLPWESVKPGSWVIDPDDGNLLTAPNICFDCTLKGGYTTQPPFWEQ